MVDVPIDNKHTVEFEFIGRDTGRNSDIVEQAETHRAGIYRMMPRRTDEAKCRVVLASEHSLGCIRSSACSEPCDVVGDWRYDGIGFDSATAMPGKCLQLRCIVRSMDTDESFGGNRLPLRTLA